MLKMTAPNILTFQILIIDDHQIYLDGLEMLLDQAIINAEIYKASTLEQAKSTINKMNYIDLILLDLNMNGGSGFDLCRLDLFEQQPVAILSASENYQDIQKAKNLGLMGFLNKASDNQVLINQVMGLLSGEKVFPVSSSPKLFLTPRQNDVLRLLAEGYPNKVICKQLNLSEATVKTHLRALFNILDVHTRTQCVNVARELNII